MLNIPSAAASSDDQMHTDVFDEDDDDWHIMQWAHERGMDPYEAVRTVRAGQAAQVSPQRDLHDGQGGSGGNRPAAAVAPALPPTGSIPPPPGLAGEIARFIYAAAPRPVAEVAIVAAIGLLAGICGKSWHIPGSGLNVYIVLVARSAIGKEAMHRGVSKLVYACQAKFPMAFEFVSFDDFASGQALIKGCIEKQCFVNVAGEIGHKFSAMAKDTDPAMRSLRRAMTNLYSKSGPEAIAGGIAYSNQENNAKADFSVAYSLIGETTPSTFYESITPDMMSDGFLSRFNVVEYVGDRPDKNPAPLEQPSNDLVQRLVNIMQQAQTMALQNRAMPVQRDAAADALMEAFSAECDSRIRQAGDDEAQRQMWNRAELKALRMAALLAVADNYLSPCVTTAHAEWAIGLVRRDIAAFGKRLHSGEIGDGTDGGRERMLLELCSDYLGSKAEDVPEYAKQFEELRKHGLVARKYLQIKTQRRAAFEKHPRGHKAALDMAIQTAIDNGHIHPLSKGKVLDEFAFHGKVFAVLNTGKFRNTNWIQAFLDDCDRQKSVTTVAG